MSRLLAIICVFLIIIGLYTHWRHPREAVAVLETTSQSADPLPDDLPAQSGDVDDQRPPKQRSIDN